MCGEKPKGCDLSRIQLQGVFNISAPASAAVVEQLNFLAGLDATVHIPCGVEPDTAGTIDIEKKLAVLAKALLLTIGRDIISVGGEEDALGIGRGSRESGSSRQISSPSDPSPGTQGEDSLFHLQGCR